MTDAPALTIAYLERLPESSARVIAGMRPQDAGALFEAIPARVLTPVIELMEKWPAALCLQHVPAELAAAILGRMPYLDAVVVLRFTPAERRGEILKELPSRLAEDLAQSLRYPRQTVGAWMDLSVPNLSVNATVRDALSILRAAQRPIGDTIFIVDGGQKLKGVIAAESLLRCSGETRLSEFARPDLKPLRARMLLREAAGEAGWDDYLRLPVIGRNGQLIGTLSRHDLRGGLAAAVAATEASDAAMSIWGQVADSFAVSIVGLIHLFGSGDAEVSVESSHAR